MPTSAPCADSRRQGLRRHLGSACGTLWLAAACLVAAILAADLNGLSGSFVFDDGPAILRNPTIRHLADLREVLSPPSANGQTVGGRPMVNLSLAVNYALGGVSVRGYHAFNLAVHVLGALTLFGLARRTLLQPALRERFGSAATPLALTIALLWAVHPLQTESVTYVIQRAESLMGLFYLLTLYCFARGAASGGDVAGPHGRSVLWLALAVLSCALGMATKEVMVSAPVLVLLYDRTFVTASWRGVWARRWRFYVSLGGTWLLLAWLVRSAQHRGGTAGLGIGDSAWTYALTQSRAIVRYLELAVWPHPLVFDYGTETIARLAEALPFALAVGSLLVIAAIALRRWPAAGFLGAWFFAILAPTSSLVPIPVQPVAEHRMYLPLAAVVALAVVSFQARWPRACWSVFAALAVAFGALTANRNADYLDPHSIWADTVAKIPGNARAQCYLGDVLAGQNRLADALVRYEEAIRLELPAAHSGERNILGDVLVNSGNVLRALGRDAEAISRYEEALRLDPGLAVAHANLGSAYLQANRLAEAVGQLEQALKIEPDSAAAHTSLGAALLLAGRTEEALKHYEAAARLDPSAKSQQDLGVALLYVHRVPEAILHLEEAIRFRPDSARAHEFLAGALAAEGRSADAVEHYRRVLELEPDNPRVRRSLESIGMRSH